MTRAEIIDLAEKAGAQLKDGFVKFDHHAGELEEFVKLILQQKEQK